MNVVIIYKYETFNLKWLPSIWGMWGQAEDGFVAHHISSSTRSVVVLRESRASGLRNFVRNTAGHITSEMIPQKSTVL